MDYKDDLDHEPPPAPAEVGWPVLEDLKEETITLPLRTQAEIDNMMKEKPYVTKVPGRCYFCGWYYSGNECQTCKDVRNAQDPELDGLNDDDDEKEEEAIGKMLDKYFQQEANKDEMFG